MDVDPTAVTALVVERFGADPSSVAELGAGVWSRCYGFDVDGRELVVRVGDHVHDFEKDRFAHRWSEPALPVPEVLEIGEVSGSWYAVSERVPGTPLEQRSRAEWVEVVPALAGALRALRRADVSATNGWGLWGSDGNASSGSWREFLLAVADDPPGRRTHGWRRALAGLPAEERAFETAWERLAALDLGEVERSVVHADLINRNVHVVGSAIAGVFDWGCSFYGDGLYELAWFEFMAPQHPEMDLPALLDACEVGVSAHRDRMLACHLHIGLDHIAFNAHLGDRTMLGAVIARMEELVQRWT